MHKVFLGLLMIVGLAFAVPSSSAQTSEIFAGDFDNGDLSQYATLQTRDHNGPPGAYCTYSACVRNGGAGHETAARFEVRTGDVPEFGGGERSEVRAPSSVDYAPGDERTYTFSFGVPADFRPPTGENGGYHSIVMQWHPYDNAASPPLHLSIDAHNNLILWHRWESKHKVIGPLDPGTWHEYSVSVKHSSDPSVGSVEVYRDGQVAVPKFNTATMAGEPGGYLKLGLYRGTEPFTQVVWHDGLRVSEGLMPSPEPTPEPEPEPSPEPQPDPVSELLCPVLPNPSPGDTITCTYQ